MIIGKDKCCDDCGETNATRYYVGFVIRDYCNVCANKHNILYDNTRR